MISSFLIEDNLGECRKLLPGGGKLYLEVDYGEGLLPLLRAELDYRGVEGGVESGHGSLLFGGKPPLTRFLALQTASQVMVTISMPSKRPAIFLAESFRPLLARLGSAVRSSKLFSAIRIEAAGRDSDLISRIGTQLGDIVDLPVDNRAGDLLVRIRHLKQGSSEWGLSFRLTPRPLTARRWRTNNVRGALDAALAAGMCLLTQAPARATILSLMCGSGTHIVEGAALFPKCKFIGVDRDPEMMALSKKHLKGLLKTGRVKLINGDARMLPLDSEQVDAVVCNPPWGEAVGADGGVGQLYADTLQECTRVLSPTGRLVFITQRDKLFEQLVDRLPDLKIVDSFKVYQGGFRPVIFVVERVT